MSRFVSALYIPHSHLWSCPTGDAQPVIAGEGTARLNMNHLRRRALVNRQTGGWVQGTGGNLTGGGGDSDLVMGVGGTLKANRQL